MGPMMSAGASGQSTSPGSKTAPTQHERLVLPPSPQKSPNRHGDRDVSSTAPGRPQTHSSRSMSSLPPSFARHLKRSVTANNGPRHRQRGGVGILGCGDGNTGSLLSAAGKMPQLAPRGGSTGLVDPGGTAARRQAAPSQADGGESRGNEATDVTGNGEAIETQLAEDDDPAAFDEEQSEEPDERGQEHTLPTRLSRTGFVSVALPGAGRPGRAINRLYGSQRPVTGLGARATIASPVALQMGSGFALALAEARSLDRNPAGGTDVSTCGSTSIRRGGGAVVGGVAHSKTPVGSQQVDRTVEGLVRRTQHANTICGPAGGLRHMEAVMHGQYSWAGPGSGQYVVTLRRDTAPLAATLRRSVPQQEQDLFARVALAGPAADHAAALSANPGRPRHRQVGAAATLAAVADDSGSQSTPKPELDLFAPLTSAVPTASLVLGTSPAQARALSPLLRPSSLGREGHHRKAAPALTQPQDAGFSPLRNPMSRSRTGEMGQHQHLARQRRRIGRHAKHRRPRANAPGRLLRANESPPARRSGEPRLTMLVPQLQLG